MEVTTGCAATINEHTIDVVVHSYNTGFYITIRGTDGAGKMSVDTTTRNTPEKVKLYILTQMNKKGISNIKDIIWKRNMKVIKDSEGFFKTKYNG